MLFTCQIFPRYMHVDTAVLLYHVVANILRANGKTTGALWHPNGLMVDAFSKIVAAKSS